MTSSTPCALAARVFLDPTADELALRRARSHQSDCPLCSSTVELFSRRGRGPLEDAVLDRLSARRPHIAGFRRLALGMLSTVQGVISLPWVFGFNPLGSVLGQPANAHLTRDGTLGFLIAVAGWVTVWRPRHAYVMLLVSAAIVAIQFGGGVVDGMDNHDALHFEAVHSLVFLIAALIGVSALGRRSPATFSDP